MTTINTAFPLRFLGVFLIALLLGAVGYFSYKHEQSAHLESIELRFSNEASHRKSRFLEKLDILSQDVRFLSSVPPIEGIMRATANNGFDQLGNSSIATWKSRLHVIYSQYLYLHPQVSQVRFIGFANNGKEIVRIERHENYPVIITGDALQTKGHRDYFKELNAQEADSIYISDINLNREHGQVVIPQEPTLRIAKKVYTSSGSPFGFVIMNFRLDNMLKTFKKGIQPDTSLYLTNANGDYIIHPHKGKAFGFDLGKRFTWQDEFSPSDSFKLYNSKLKLFTDQQQDFISNTYVISLQPENPERDLFLRFTTPASAFYLDVLAHTVEDTLAAAAILFLCVFLVFITRTNRRQRHSLLDEKARSSAILKNSHDAIISQDTDGNITGWNHSAEKLFGYSEEEAIGNNTTDLIVVDKRSDTYNFESVLKGATIPPIEMKANTKSNEKLDISASLSPIRDTQGNIIGVARAIRDISQQKENEKKIHELNTKLKEQIHDKTSQFETVSALKSAILENAGNAIIAADTKGIISLFNPSAEKMLGYKAEELIGKKTPAIFHCEEEVIERAKIFSKELGYKIPLGFDVFVAKSREGLPNTHEWIYIRKDGSRLNVQLSVTALRTPDNEIFGYLGMASDITQQVKEREKLTTSMERLITAAEIAELGMWTWDINSNQLTWNKNMHDIYQIPEKELESGLTYDHWFNAVHPDDRDHAVAKLNSALDGNGEYNPEFRVVRPDGSIRYIVAAGSVERDADNKPSFVIGINKDVTEQLEHENALKAAKEEAEFASQAKSDFLANMSHEIRTPLNGILGILGLLRKTELNDRQQEYLSLISTSADTLLNIISDILDISKIEAGKLTIEQVDFSLENKVGEIVKGFSPIAGKKGIDLNYYISPNVPSQIISDPIRMGQIIFNLVGNAIKFTDTGSVEVRLQISDQESQELTYKAPFNLQIDVIDTGIGIPDDKKQAIFDSFTQADTSTTRRYGGTGLGLAIISNLVKLMNGTIDVQSEEKKGSHFIIKLPVATGNTRSLEAINQAPWLKSTKEISKLHCLVVDSNEANLSWLQDTLVSWGCNPVIAVSAKEAKEYCHQASQNNEPFDVLLLDRNMSDMSAFQLVEQLRESGISPSKVILMLSSSDEHCDHQRRKQLGISAHLTKPVRPLELYNTMAAAVPHNTPDTPSDTGESYAGKTSHPLHILVAEDNELNQLVVEGILEDRGHEVDFAKDGAQAIDLVNQKAYDVVLMDIQMPNIDGLEATRIILQKHPDLKIIGLTAHALKGDKENCLNAGMQNYVTKPIDAEVLLQALEQPDLDTLTNP